MVNFEEAKRLIQEKKFFDISQINFDINQIDSQVTHDFHDSNAFENEFIYITQKTLLHIAIECRNKKALIDLMRHGANPKIDIERIEKRKQRYTISGDSLFGAASGSDREEWEPTITSLSTIKLAEETSDPEIISIISGNTTSIEKKEETCEPKKYSASFITLYDEIEPTSGIGRGCHYSIFRAKDNTSQNENQFFDFAIIWDEDHDERIIGVLENLYMEKKLINYIIVGERKGGFTAILHPSRQREISNSLPECFDIDWDSWSTKVLTLKEVDNGSLIHDSKGRAEEYINSIIEKWELGIKTFKIKKIIDDVVPTEQEQIQDIKQTLTKWKDCIEKGNLDEIPEYHDGTLLHLAVDKNMKDVVIYLLKNREAFNLDINGVDFADRTALWNAVSSNYLEIAQLLIQAGANVELAEGKDITGYANKPLHEAVYRENFAMVKLLVVHGANFDSLNGIGETPVGLAEKKELHEIFSFLKINSEKVERAVQEQIVCDPYQGKIVKKIGKMGERKVSMYGFPDKKQAQQKEVRWQKQTVAKFFKIGKSLQEGRQSYKIYQHIVTQIEAKDKKALDLNGCCRRSLIIALSKVLTKYKGMPNLNFKLGTTVIKFIPADENGTRRQIGNFKMEIPNCYDIAYGDGCIKRLSYLLEPQWDTSSYNKDERKKVLLNLLKAKLQQIKPFSYMDLNKYGNIRIFNEEISNSYDEKTQKNVHFLNGLLFLVTTVEVLVRLYRTQDGKIFPYSDEKGIESDSFPIAIAQARSLDLLLTGKILFIDFFGQSKSNPNYNSEQHRAYCGVATGKGTIDNIKMMVNKLLLVNNLHNTVISNLQFWQDLKKDYLKSNKDGYLLEGRSRMYFDLKECYGSGSESDTESSDYSSSDDELEVIEFKPKL